MVRSSLASFDPTIEPRLLGGKGSTAAALDGALSKEPAWVLSSFGVFPNGMPVSRRLFARSNPGRKRLGPVAISLASKVKGGDVGIYVNGKLLQADGELREVLEELEGQTETKV
jgi:hypothetical protein